MISGSQFVAGVAYLQYKTVSGRQYATRPFAGNALFRPLGQTVA
jgi:hypothetical protein